MFSIKDKGFNKTRIILFNYSVSILLHGMQCTGLLNCRANGDRNQLGAWLDSDLIAEYRCGSRISFQGVQIYKGGLIC